MATTLTLGGSGFTNPLYNTTANYAVVDITKVQDTITVLGNGGDDLTAAQETFFFSGNNSATLSTDPANGTVTKVSLDLGNGNDTLVVNASLIGNPALSPSNASQAKIELGGGNDSVTLNQFVQRYMISLGGGDDTLVINEFTATSAADVRNAAFNLGAGADTLLVNADLFAVNINVGGSVTSPDGADTIVLRGTNDESVSIANFDISNDVLIIGGVSFSAADYTGPTGTFNQAFNLAGSSVAIDAVNDWLNNGTAGNSISLI